MIRRRTALAVVSIAVAALLAGCAPAAGGPDWSAYPGYSTTDPEYLLARPSLEAVTAESEAMLAEIRDQVTAEFGVVWIAEEPYRPPSDDNGYGGTSMLRDLEVPQWRGAVEAEIPEARQRIHEIIGEVATRHGADSFTINNERDRLEPNRAEYYGAEDLEDQPHWSSHALGGPDELHEIYTEVYDTAYPADPAYNEGEPDGLDGEPIDPDVPTISVVMHVSGPGLLSEGDRAEFIERLKPYEGLRKPS